jgi:hypothetical protein
MDTVKKPEPKAPILSQQEMFNGVQFLNMLQENSRLTKGERDSAVGVLNSMIEITARYYEMLEQQSMEKVPVNTDMLQEELSQKTRPL